MLMWQGNFCHQASTYTRDYELIGREGTWYTKQPLLFHSKYNYLPAYLVPMTPPLTPQPERPQGTVATAESTSTQLFGFLYITLTDLVDAMVSTNSPWALLRKYLSYIVKLAPILWWALSTGHVGCPPTSSPETATGWLPGTYPGLNAAGNPS
ncbi:hypothetical protein DSO57_1015374 [Entomophthora muscae]|uniref:Uncharacterized protein n=1 Tax=Entomophthora muscae TaxID=34485 RepID=A0ACC2RWJ9_9FUNG|nr:hypothetical protein DSO57_1015374 [Entomophthora muscae]